MRQIKTKLNKTTAKTITYHLFIFTDLIWRRRAPSVKIVKLIKLNPATMVTPTNGCKGQYLGSLASQTSKALVHDVLNVDWLKIG